jgi:SAM-dependent methyltransferase
VDDSELRVDPRRPPFPNYEHVEFLSFAIERMGPLGGARLLEVGCGTGALSVFLALQGATVTGIDVSEEAVRVAERRAAASGVAETTCFRAVPAEQLLDEGEGSYDLIAGNQVLHHLELRDALPALRRMLRPGGRGVFCEPVLLIPSWARRIREHPRITRLLPRRVDTPTERSISGEDLALVRAVFPRVQVYPFQLLARVQNFAQLDAAWFGRIAAVDRALLRRGGALRRLARFLVIEVER